MKVLIGDFETTTYPGQDHTEVWASAWVNIEDRMETESVHVNNAIDKFFSELFSLHDDVVCYFHNLKFDGMFIFYYLWYNPIFKEASFTDKDGFHLMNRKQFKDAPDGSYIYTVSDRGVWYSISVKFGGHTIVFLDSLKILPFSVKEIGKAFKTQHQKTSIEYEGYREQYGEITPEEREYIANDVLVVAEALIIMFSQGHDKTTIGANCLAEFKNTGDMATDRHLYRTIFPDLYKVFCPFPEFKDTDDYVRKSYHGGWCYLKRGLENKPFHEEITICDVNSLYPSVMSGESGNAYPYGHPSWFKGSIPEKVYETFNNGRRKYYFFVRVRTRFYLKPGKLPTIQIKGSPFYNAREWLESSDYVYRGVAHRQYVDEEGNIKDVIPTLTLTQTDWQLLNEHYDLEDTEILDGCYFRCKVGFFDEYINKWREVKENSKGAMRTLAKLFLNNLYGKLASSDESGYKRLYIEDGKCMSEDIEAHDKQSGFIPAGSAVTSYAREFTIRAAQKNYEHFIYADTDSIHCNCSADEIVGAPEHPTKFLHWKYEGTADSAVYVRAKRYIEHIVGENRQPVEPYYNIKCAGMGKQAKQIVENKLNNGTMRLDEFRSGLVVPGNLKAMNIDGGIILREQEFRLH